MDMGLFFEVFTFGKPRKVMLRNKAIIFSIIHILKTYNTIKTYGHNVTIDGSVAKFISLR